MIDVEKQRVTNVFLRGKEKEEKSENQQTQDRMLRTAGNSLSTIHRCCAPHHAHEGTIPTMVHDGGSPTILGSVGIPSRLPQFNRVYKPCRMVILPFTSRRLLLCQNLEVILSSEVRTNRTSRRQLPTILLTIQPENLQVILSTYSRMPRTSRVDRNYLLYRLLAKLYDIHMYFTDVIGIYGSKEASKENEGPYRLISITFNRKPVSIVHLPPHDPRTPRNLRIEAEFTAITKQGKCIHFFRKCRVSSHSVCVCIPISSHIAGKGQKDTNLAVKS
ncbi:uncharacterized protein LOC118450973 isoform X3 [Vespa mandarinia]|uniref:uncharacterized protein LOC118450973 isoform X3 n=1 Tax=Vespa mandarinia TaxID=7446 RepID=UPI00160D6C57|nr:uncharacterized protein LOC118450973 isoform X3 [Vespa mandarinia]